MKSTNVPTTKHVLLSFDIWREIMENLSNLEIKLIV